MKEMAPQPDKLTIVKKILEMTRDMHYGAKTNHTSPRPGRANGVLEDSFVTCSKVPNKSCIMANAGNKDVFGYKPWNNFHKVSAHCWKLHGEQLEMRAQMN